jgi:hypothetical protein
LRVNKKERGKIMTQTCGCEPTLNAVDKIRRKGVSSVAIPQPFEIICTCGHLFIMSTHEAKCDSCDMVYGITPCSVDSIDNVVAVGVDY